MKLRIPPSPFEKLTIHEDSLTVDTSGKVLVIPTGNVAILPSYNEFALNSNRLTIAESPFGGLKGSGSPDYSAGTVNIIEGDGVYLQDVSGTNSTKTLTAGKLKELSLLTVDTVGHSITEEFIVENTAESNNPTIIINGDSVSGWSMLEGTGTITSENGRLKIVGNADSAGKFRIKNASDFEIGTKDFISAEFESSLAGKLSFAFYDAGSNYSYFTGTYYTIQANNITKFILPIHAPQGTGSLPTKKIGASAYTTIGYMYIGVNDVGANAEITLYIDNITADTAKPAYIELQTPDNLSATSTIIQCWGGSAYAECRRDSLDGTYSNISSTPANMKMLDGTKFDDVYGAGLGQAYFPKGVSGETKAGSSGDITYSANKGTRNRIGFRIDLPPSDGGRTNFNKIRLKIITNNAADAEGNYSATYDFADSTNTSYGLQNLSLPWIALYDPAGSTIDFYRFTVRPQSLSFKRNEAGIIHELILYPGNGQIYHGQITYAGLTTDTDSDTIPDCLEASVEGSVTKFLQSYGMI